VAFFKEYDALAQKEKLRRPSVRPLMNEGGPLTTKSEMRAEILSNTKKREWPAWWLRATTAQWKAVGADG